MSASKQILKQLWSQRESQFKGWHGYTTDPNSGKVTVYFIPKTDPTALIKALDDQGISQVEPEFVSSFHQVLGGSKGGSGSFLQVGQAVSAMIPGCSKTCTGTITAFLTLTPPQNGDRIWLLSSHHVMVPVGKCLTISPPGSAAVQILDGRGVLISNSVRFAKTPNGDFLDAALAPVASGSNLYDPDLKISGTDPISADDLQPGISTVTKQGLATHVTAGIFMGRRDVFSVFDRCSNTSIDYMDVLCVASSEGTLFGSDTDSGSLVVAQGRPLGLLSAMTEHDESNAAALGLVTPFDVVIEQLSPLVDDPPKGRSLVMLSLTLQSGATQAEPLVNVGAPS